MGKIRVEAEGDELQLLGQKRVTVQSHGDWVHITGKEGVLINGGGSYIKVWDGGIEYGTKAGWVVHARTYGFEGARSLEMPVLPKGEFAAANSVDNPLACTDCDEFIKFILHYVFPDGTKKLAKNAAYSVLNTKNGSVLAEGVSDENGVIKEQVCKDRYDELKRGEIRIHAEMEF
jgi:hypothetical protein